MILKNISGGTLKFGGFQQDKNKILFGNEQHQVYDIEDQGTIEIDDSGTGDLIGPAFICGLRTETGQMSSGEIGLDLYQSTDHNNLSQARAAEIVLEILSELNVLRFTSWESRPLQPPGTIPGPMSSLVSLYPRGFFLT